jgi:iron complex transport system substrate-binding protein
VAARPQRVIRLTAACLAAVLLASCDGTAQVPLTSAPERIVSLVPAATEMLFAIGAGHSVVGVSSFDNYPPEVQSLPRVGALLDPDTEQILALRPGLVVVYASQTEAVSRFERAGIRTFSVRHGGIATVLETMRKLGEVTGRSADAESAARDLRVRIDAVRTRVKGLRRPRVLLLLGREPTTLRNMYVSGGIGFTHEMLDAAGGANVFADVARESVQPTHEVLIARSPDVIVEVRATGPLAQEGQEESRRAWSILSSIPAVQLGRIHALVGEPLVVPGPRLAEGVETLARALHPEAFR